MSALAILTKCPLANCPLVKCPLAECLDTDWAYIKDPMPPSFIHQVIFITGLNKLYNCMFSP